jgi:hypothetical protein
MPNRRESKEVKLMQQQRLFGEQKQGNAPFRFLIRPVTTVNVSKGKLANMLEDGIFSFLKNQKFLSSISGILILPTIIDNSIAVPPKDYVGYKKGDNSVSVGINIDFLLWERSSELERLMLLTENIQCSLEKIKSRYLIDFDRENLHHIVDDVHKNLAGQLLN